MYYFQLGLGWKTSHKLHDGLKLGLHAFGILINRRRDVPELGKTYEFALIGSICFKWAEFGSTVLVLADIRPLYFYNGLEWTNKALDGLEMGRQIMLTQGGLVGPDLSIWSSCSAQIL